MRSAPCPVAYVRVETSEALTSASYVVTGDVDAVFQRSVAANAEIVARPHETVFGSGVATRAFTARDPAGNLWTFGSYRGAP
jgi:uncharacterized glyoxalase superfamily protein PhnB